MDLNSVLDILQKMMDGIDPLTGEILPADHLCNYPDVMRALHTAILTMTPNPAPDNTLINKKNGKPNASRPWTEAELKELERLYLAEIPIDEICAQLQRRERGIHKQLQYLGLIESEKQPSKNPVLGLERAGLPWLYSEDILLNNLYEKKLHISEIAAELHRSEHSIFCRMERNGLFGEDNGYPVDAGQQKWSSSDISHIRDMFNEGKSAEEIAEYFNVSAKNIAARLFYMGLIKESPISLRPQHNQDNL